MNETAAPAPNATVAPTSDAEQSRQDSVKLKTNAGLWWPRAVLQSLFNASVDFYPRLNTKHHRFPTNTKAALRDLFSYPRLPTAVRDWAASWQLPGPDKRIIASLKSDDILADMATAMKDWTGPITAGDVAELDAAKAVLEKIVAQDEPSKEQLVAIQADAKAALQKMTAPELSLDDAIDLAKTSLTEVKAQTEYQDQKATRLLTVTTFLSALSGALFASFSASYPLALADRLDTGWRLVLIGAYLTFVLFVLAAVAGALVTFHATRTRFKYSKEATAKRQAGPTRSFLFFREMIGVSPEGWAKSFVEVGQGGPVLRPQLKEEYFKNYVMESYLVAAKTADKLRYLGPAQSLLAWALRCLLLFVILITLIQAYVAKQPAVLTQVKLLWPEKPVEADVDLIQMPARTAGSDSKPTGHPTPIHVRVHVQGSK